MAQTAKTKRASGKATGRASTFVEPVMLAATVAAGLALPAPAIAGESAPEMIVITARPPDPVGNAAFSTTLLSEQQVQISPQLDQSLRQVPGLSLFRRNSSLSANPSVQGVSLRSIAGSGAGRALVTRSYAAALDAGYLWHEFGDVHLILP